MRSIYKIIVIVLIFIISIFLLLLIVRPALVRSGRHLSKIIEEEERNTRLNNELDSYLEDRDNYYLLNAEYQKLAMELPDKDDTVILTNELYEIARYTNVNISNLAFTEQGIDVEDLRKTPEKEISIDIVLEGSYYEILNFINTIEIMPRIIIIENVIMQNVSDDYDKLSTFINAKTFFINESYGN
jgi:Tfp pilus assembly protein PilO